ncbi:hypothetical protein NDU88_000923 [Pleurodeles waltl]|uniref:Uncharacterized protein n=1 Tax=Pleurodeles waltl TaxID=8319 RepID=A0AAV7P282_PLEWA|nr:hypothetical protein NDU88_000923 [Pleurodeles waltl]
MGHVCRSLPPQRPEAKAPRGQGRGLRKWARWCPGRARLGVGREHLRQEPPLLLEGNGLRASVASGQEKVFRGIRDRPAFLRNTDLSFEEDRDLSFEAHRDLPFEEHRDPSFEAHRDPSFEAHRDPSYEAHRDPSYEAPRDLSFEVWRDLSCEAPRDLLFEAPKGLSLKAHRDLSFKAPRDQSFEAPRDLSFEVWRDLSCEARGEGDLWAETHRDHSQRLMHRGHRHRHPETTTGGPSPRGRHAVLQAPLGCLGASLSGPQPANHGGQRPGAASAVAQRAARRHHHAHDITGGVRRGHRPGVLPHGHALQRTGGAALPGLRLAHLHQPLLDHSVLPASPRHRCGPLVSGIQSG